MLPYATLADLTVLVHATFVLFAAGGGLLVWRWSRLAWIHLPAAGWAVAIEWTGGICPLTTLEGWLRRQAGVGVHAGDFIDRYVLWWLYPAGLTREVQIGLGAALLLLNLAVYARWIATRRRRTRAGGEG